MNLEDLLSGAEDVPSNERASRSRKLPKPAGHAGAQFLASVERMAAKAVSSSAHRKDMRKLFQAMRRSASSLERQHRRWLVSETSVTEFCRQELDRLFLMLAVERARTPAQMAAALARASLLVQLREIATNYPDKPKKPLEKRERKSVGDQEFRNRLSPLPHQASLQVAAAVRADRDFRARTEALQKDGLP